MITKIINGKIITNKIEEKALYIKDDIIFDITNDSYSYDRLIDAEGLFVSPGFIDMHTHGGGGYDFLDGGVEPFLEATRLHLKHGTTSIMPTSTASSFPATINFIQDAIQAMQDKDINSHIIGVHLEGPYFSANQSGAQNPAYIKPPDKEEYHELLRIGRGVIKRWSFAPELAGSEEFVNALVQNDIIPSIAHTDAVYSDIERVYSLGCHLVTHLYSAMSSITRKNGHRILGTVEAAYLLDQMMVEVIADGIHLPIELLRLIYKIKGPDWICLVTDSMRGAGMADGKSFIGRRDEGLPCIIENGVAILPDRSAFAGSVATADRIVRTFYKQVKVDLINCIKMMTQNPAQILGLKKKGYLTKNYDADIIFFDDDIQIKKVIVKGVLQ